MTTITLNDLSGPALAKVYNTITGENISRFATLPTGVARVERALMQQTKVIAELKEDGTVRLEPAAIVGTVKRADLPDLPGFLRRPNRASVASLGAAAAKDTHPGSRLKMAARKPAEKKGKRASKEVAKGVELVGKRLKLFELLVEGGKTEKQLSKALGWTGGCRATIGRVAQAVGGRLEMEGSGAERTFKLVMPKSKK